MKYVIVDVDGVLNFDDHNAYSFDVEASLAAGYSLRMNRKHGKWLLDLAEETDSTLIWGTTWMELANLYIGPQIGLPELPVAKPASGERRFSEDVFAWKARGVREFVGDNPGVWLDDDTAMLRPYMAGTNVRLVTVNWRTGLTAENIDLARKILQENM